MLTAKFLIAFKISGAKPKPGISSAGTEKTLTFKYVLIKTSVSLEVEKKWFIAILIKGIKIRIIKATIKEDLPEGFQKSHYVQKSGFVDLIVDRKDLAEKIGTLLSILLNKNSAISTEENEITENTQSLSKVAS